MTFILDKALLAVSIGVMLTLMHGDSLWAKWQLIGGSFLGSAHARLGRNNQDGFALGRCAAGLVAVVTDGCSAGRFSEVGAQIGARLLAKAIISRQARGEDPTTAAGIAGWLCTLQRLLGAFASALGSKGADHDSAFRDPEVIADYLLFGFLVAIVTPQTALIAGIGDGLWGVNGSLQVLDPGPDNAPPYAAYALLPELRAALGGALNLRVHYRGPSAELQTLIIASDGAHALQRHAEKKLRSGREAGGVGQFFAPSYRKNPSLVQKRLRLIAEQAGPLDDDITLALLCTEGATR